MTRKYAWALLGWYCLASAGLSGMANAALKLAQPAPCADCADKHAAVVDAEPPASPAAGDPPPARPCPTCDGYGNVHRLSCPQASPADV